MNKRARSKSGRKAAGTGQLWLRLPGLVREALYDTHVVLAAIGVDERGAKHVLGLREGASANASAVRALLADLVERGLDPHRSRVM